LSYEPQLHNPDEVIFISFAVVECLDVFARNDLTLRYTKGFVRERGGRKLRPPI